VSEAFPTLGPDALEPIAALCARGLADPPTVDDLGASLFTPGFPVSVRGDPDRGVVASCVRDGAAYLRLLVVSPACRGRGLGTRLLEAAEAELAPAGTVTVGADAPDHLFPGVETTQLEMLCLLERHHYVRGEANYNLLVDLERLPSAPSAAEASVARAAEGGEIDEWITANWPNWRTETLRCLERDRLMVSRDEEGIVAFCCWDGARAGWVGPVGVRPSVIGQGRGRAVLVAALHHLRAEGRDQAEIGWVGPIRPYARTVPSRINRVFFVYRKQRSASPTP
jgi:GNAT superfamily N-acetyltransferase